MPLERDLYLLEVLTTQEAQRRGSLGVSRIAALAGMDVSVVSRALKALELEGVVIRDSVTRGYSLGWRLPMLLAPTAVSSVMVIANDAIRELAVRYPESTQSLVVLRRNRIFLPYNVSAGQVFPDQPWSGAGHPAFCTSAGRVLLSDRTPAELRRVYPGGLDLEEAPDSSVRTIDDLIRVVQRAKADGYAATENQYRRGLIGAAAPIRDNAGAIIAAINVAGFQITEGHPQRQQELDAVGREVAQVVSAASKRLGWIPFPVA